MAVVRQYHCVRFQRHVVDLLVLKASDLGAVQAPEISTESASTFTSAAVAPVMQAGACHAGDTPDA